ncbi:Tas retrotransposon peptidase A16 [Ancylostoma duodenale]|uniref:Tas retrotransposon peptidase A16 n=1 Tax=Ancylostoma duodenale TaxID=51022 RepID=A0A0C2G8M3_9BILA|nr:Tas retrotransposon peptidase A16 [Ancylostoma duodenale]
MPEQPFLLKNVKQKLTRQLNILANLVREADEFREPWNFPTQEADLDLFLSSNQVIVKNLISKLEQKREAISEYYALCNCTINDIVQEDKTDKIEIKLKINSMNTGKTRRQDLTRRHVNETSSQHQPSQTPEQSSSTARGWAMERRLLGNELTIPPFYGNPSEFGPFWELFDELVHKQPYSNIEKLSILINCCKGDAARTLQMIPRTGESYDKAIAQLKNQYEDPRRITMQMIRQLKTMRQCREDPRSLRNNLSDVQAIIATLEKQGEVVNTTNMMSMVLDTFSKNMQDEMARKEFDSGKVWTMTDLLNNLNVAVKRREHVDSLKESNREERSVFHTSTTTTSLVRCTGCGQHHKFQYCDKYPSVAQKIERLRTINACWKCFSRNHHTQLCRKHNCAYCGGPHNLILCKKRQRQPNEGSGNSSRYRYTSPSRSEYGRPTRRYTRSRSYSPSGTFRSRSYSLDLPAFGSRDRAHVRNEQLQSRITPKISTRPFNDRGILKHDPELPTRTSTQQEQRVRFQRSPSRRRRSLENVTVNFQTQSEEIPENHNEKVTSPLTKHEEVRLMIVPIQIGPTQSEEKETVFALLDSASDQSFITTSLAQRLNLKIYNETNIVVNTFDGKAEKRRVKRVVTPLYNSLGDYITVEFLTHEKITPPFRLGCMLPQDSSFIQEHFSEQEVQWISQVTNITVTPEILIGMDYFNTIMVLHEPVIRLSSGLFITPTFFGPVISGVPHEDNWRPEKDNFYEQIVHTYTAHNTSDRHLDISDLWKLPTIGIEDMITEEEINKQIVNDFYSTVQIQDGKIYVRFPWKPNKASLSNNYNLALKKYRLCKEIFNNNMSMNLRQFLTNDDVCNRTIASADLSTTKNTKILGIPWNHNSDSLAIPCKLKYVPTSTKRKVLQATHSTFGPLGLLTPLLLPAKLFLQNLWKLGYKWDEPLSPDLDCEWQTICEQAAGVYIYKKVSSEHQVKFKKAIPEIEAVGDGKPLATLDAADLSSAEKILIKTAQKTFSQQEFKKLDNLQLYNDEDGIIRCKGRIKTPQLSRETLEPILLPQKHPFTNLFVQDAHLRCGHQGVNGTLANIRLKYWIPTGRQVVKKYLKSCLKCKRWNARPYFYPNSPPLPRQRTQPSRPFSHVMSASSAKAFTIVPLTVHSKTLPPIVNAEQGTSRGDRASSAGLVEGRAGPVRVMNQGQVVNLVQVRTRAMSTTGTRAATLRKTEQPREPPVAQPNQPPNEIAPMHRKITRLLGKTDEMQPLLSSTRGMIHTMDQRTITIKNLVDTCLDGLEELFDLHKKLLQELQDQGVLKDKNNSNSKRKASRSPSPGPSRVQDTSKSRRCPFCEGDHYASDCTKVTHLRERRQRLFERDRCERCLQRANHLATSCKASNPCFYGKTEKREAEMNKHHSAFCPFKFPM